MHHWCLLCAPLSPSHYLYIYLYIKRENLALLGFFIIISFVIIIIIIIIIAERWMTELKKNESFNILKLLFWMFCKSMGAVDSKNQPTKKKEKKLRTKKKSVTDKTKTNKRLGFFCFGFCFFFSFFSAGLMRDPQWLSKNSDWERSIQKMYEKN